LKLINIVKKDIKGLMMPKTQIDFPFKERANIS
jgi:hypothetical protein